MRLTQEQIAATRISVNEVFGLGAQVWLFGSRVDDRRCGGDTRHAVIGEQGSFSQ